MASESKLKPLKSTKYAVSFLSIISLHTTNNNSKVSACKSL